MARRATLCAQGEKVAKKPKKSRGPRPFCKGRCRDCGQVEVVPKRDFYHASQPRCSACGGLIDRILWKRRPKPAITDGQTRKVAVEAASILCEDGVGPRKHKLILEEFWRAARKIRGNSKSTDRRRERLLGLLKLMEEVRIEYRKQRSLAARRGHFSHATGIGSLSEHPLCFCCKGPASARHHVIALGHGGINSRRNVVSLCADCHAEIHPHLKSDANRAKAVRYELGALFHASCAQGESEANGRS